MVQQVRQAIYLKAVIWDYISLVRSLCGFLSCSAVVRRFFYNSTCVYIYMWRYRQRLFHCTKENWNIVNNYIAIIIGSKMESLCVAFGFDRGDLVCCFISQYSRYIHFDFFVPCVRYCCVTSLLFFFAEIRTVYLKCKVFHWFEEANVRIFETWNRRAVNSFRFFFFCKWVYVLKATNERQLFV